MSRTVMETKEGLLDIKMRGEITIIPSNIVKSGPANYEVYDNGHLSILDKIAEYEKTKESVSAEEAKVMRIKEKLEEYAAYDDMARRTIKKYDVYDDCHLSILDMIDEYEKSQENLSVEDNKVMQKVKNI